MEGGNEDAPISAEEAQRMIDSSLNRVEKEEWLNDKDILNVMLGSTIYEATYFKIIEEQMAKEKSEKGDSWTERNEIDFQNVGRGLKRSEITLALHADLVRGVPLNEVVRIHHRAFMYLIHDLRHVGARIEGMRAGTRKRFEGLGEVNGRETIENGVDYEYYCQLELSRYRRRPEEVKLARESALERARQFEAELGQK